MKRLNRKKATGVLALFLCTTVFAACGGRDASYTDNAKEQYTATAPAEAEESVDYEGFTEEAIASEAGSVAALPKPEVETDKLIYSGNLRLQTLEYEQTRKSIHAKIEAAGGFVQWENEYDNNDSWYYASSSRATKNTEIQARIPSEKFSSFIEDMEGEGRVMSREVSVENITQTYRETEATVKAYEIERDRLLEMMDKAETIEDMIAVEARLSEVEAELSRHKTSLSSMDRDVNYSTVTIWIEEVRVYTEEIDDSTLVSRLKETARSSWRGFLRFLEGLLHLFIRLLPFLVLGALLFVLVRVLDKKFGGKHQQKRMERKQRRAEAKEWKRRQKQMRKGQMPPQEMNGLVPPQEMNRPVSPLEKETKDK